MKAIKTNRRFLFLYMVLSLIAGGLNAQKLQALEPISITYKPLKEKSTLPTKERQALDTIQYPWAEYSKGALGNALWRTVYLSPQDEAKLSGLITLPANSSDQTRGDLDYLLNLQNNRTKQETDRAEYIANIGSWPNIVNPTDPDYVENRQQLYYILNTALGKKYDYADYPATTTLLMNCIQDIRVTEFRLKQHFKRPRPYHLEPALKPLTRINSPSFPSGHSLWAYTEAFIFSELFPEKRAAFLKVAAEVQWSRELMGIHYPSDNEASRIIGWNLIKFWMNNSQFITDLKNAKLEISGKR
ncbi:phosphatase PAP2 family protein [Niastella sp. OAS944]|uniref:phosphatase PAP2 family protein n=1 Tax=Niastella sp. OAS944 TaxID=2664089 RepID=UPI00346F4FB9|nr:acid phosphatase (class A) [Chitinophagaceae bacterium OAS944]